MSVRSANHAEQQFGFGDDLIADIGGRLRARQRVAPPAERDFEAHPVAGDDLAAELRVVDAAQIDARVRRRIVALSSSIAATCDHDSSISTAGSTGAPGNARGKTLR